MRISNVLVTGGAGFIGFHVVAAMLKKGFNVVSVDSINDYYDTELKQNRLNEINKHFLHSSNEYQSDYKFYRGDLCDLDFVKQIFDNHDIELVIHLAAQAGVRYSMINPHAYVESNIIAFVNVLEISQKAGVKHFVYASTSSVYGANQKMPFSEHDQVNHPLQFYAATKRANELMAHSYSHLYKLPTTGLRFFTVYGPWGRPDMAPFIFVKNIIEGKPIQVFNGGHHSRDFTYISDIVEAIVRVSEKYATPNISWNGFEPDPASSIAPFRIFNIGNGSPIKLLDFIRAIENTLSMKALIEFLPKQLGDVEDTHSDSSNLEKFIDFKPKTPLNVGVEKLVDWYTKYYNKKSKF
jgi:UDP-glucuronate 4-epimerase